MAAGRNVTVSIEMVELEAGLWCDACALPSAVRMTFAMSIGGRTTIDSRVACVEEQG